MSKTVLIPTLLLIVVFSGCAHFSGGNLLELVGDAGPTKGEIDNYKFDPLHVNEKAIAITSNETELGNIEFDLTNETENGNGNDFVGKLVLEKSKNEPSVIPHQIKESPEPFKTKQDEPTIKMSSSIHDRQESTQPIPPMSTSIESNSGTTNQNDPGKERGIIVGLQPVSEVPVSIFPDEIASLPKLGSELRISGETSSGDTLISERPKLPSELHAKFSSPSSDDRDTVPELDNLNSNLELQPTTTQLTTGATAESPNTDALEIPKFVQELISSTMDPESVEIVSAPIRKPTNPSPESVETRATWSEQLDQTIDAFKLELNNDSSKVRNIELSNGLQILRSLKRSLSETKHVSDESTPIELKQYWNHQIDALNAIMQGSDSDWNSAATEALQHLNQAARPLRNSANLKLNSACFCRKVSGFGQYETFDELTFGPQHRVLVYCEIENFAPIENSSDQANPFQTKVSSSYTVTDESGVVVQEMNFPPVSDHARKIRTDFFMHIPVQFDGLSTGEYDLQIKVTDFGSGKTANLDQPLTFRIR